MLFLYVPPVAERTFHGSENPVETFQVSFAVIWIRVKFKTLVGTEVGFWLWHGWHRHCWGDGRNGASALIWAPRMRTKGYVAPHLSIVIETAPLLLILKSPQFAVRVSPANSLAIKRSWGRVSSFNDRAERYAILKLGNFAGISSGLKT